MTRTLAALMVLAGAAAFAADPPAAIDTKTLDKSIFSTLREIHDRGADLYNQSKDYTGTFRLYEGSLLTVRPLLGHRPDVQKAIDAGLAAAAADTDPARKAFLLHEVIEKVRAELKGESAKSVEPKPKVPNPNPNPKDVSPKKVEPAPMPKAKEPKAGGASVEGQVRVQGKPLAEGTVLFVSLDLKAPKVASAKIKDGAYSVKDLPVGKYAVAVSSETAGAVPAKFSTTDTSSLAFQTQAGANQFDIDLK